jgi:hypothetical protein
MKKSWKIKGNPFPTQVPGDLPISNRHLWIDSCKIHPHPKGIEHDERKVHPWQIWDLPSSLV